MIPKSVSQSGSEHERKYRLHQHTAIGAWQHKISQHFHPRTLESR